MNSKIISIGNDFLPLPTPKHCILNIPCWIGVNTPNFYPDDETHMFDLLQNCTTTLEFMFL